MLKKFAAFACFSALTLGTVSAEDFETLKGHWLFGGADVGPSFMSAGSAGEADKTGIHFDAKGLYSYIDQRWLIDLGAGWFYNRMTGDLTTSLGNIAEKTVTRAALLEISPRFRVLPALDLGVSLQGYMGTDVRFRSTGVIENSFSAFAGPVAKYTVLLDRDFALRFALSALTDLTVRDRQVFLLLAGIELGFRLSGNRAQSTAVDVSPAVVATPVPSPEPTPEPTPEIVASPVPTPAPTPVVEEPRSVTGNADVIVTLNTENVYFRFDKSELSVRSHNIIRSLGKFLGEHPNEWTKLTLEGHTDYRGTDEYNQLLSERRAASVRRVFVASGVPADKIVSIGYGEKYPKEKGTDEISLARNRRCELLFDGISNIPLFKEELEKIIRKYGKPEIFPYMKH